MGWFTWLMGYLLGKRMAEQQNQDRSDVIHEASVRLSSDEYMDGWVQLQEPADIVLDMEISGPPVAVVFGPSRQIEEFKQNPGNSVEIKLAGVGGTRRETVQTK